MRPGSAAGPGSPDERLAASLAALVPDGARLLLAVSGGSDSVALLGAAARTVPGRCHVAHVDHGLRPGSGEDARWVAALCAELGLPATVVRAPPGPLSPGRSETAARGRRAAALAQVAERTGSRWILLAHHRDDTLETLLLQLARGHRGDRALAGIPTVRSGPGGHLLRPFLYGPQAPGRAELARARSCWGLEQRDDPSNRDLRIPRNAMRALLAQGHPPLTAERLEAVQRAARARLGRRLAAVVCRLETDLVPEGQGARLSAAAFEPEDGDEPFAMAAEVIRLLGLALAAPRRLVVRRSLLEQLRARLIAGRGRLTLPGSPAALEIQVSRAGVHLPGAPPVANHPGWVALGRSPLYLG